MRGGGQIKAREADGGSLGVPGVRDERFRAGQGERHPAGEAGVVVIARVVDVLAS
jgi:hypothetical protein